MVTWVPGTLFVQWGGCGADKGKGRVASARAVLKVQPWLKGSEGV